MLALKGVYKNGKIELLEPLPSIESADLFIIVSPHPPETESKEYTSPRAASADAVMESRGDWQNGSAIQKDLKSESFYSAVLRQMVTPDANGYIHIQVPKGLADRFEVLLLPAQRLGEGSGFFEGIDEEGISYKLDEWTEEEFNVQSMTGAFKDDPTEVEDLFDV